MKSDKKQSLGCNNDMSVEFFDPQQGAADLLEIAEKSSSYGNNQSEFWRHLTAGALVRFENYNTQGLESLQTDFQIKFVRATILADWVEADIIAFQLEKLVGEIIFKEERRFRDIASRLPLLTEKTVKNCKESVKNSARKTELSKVLRNMLDSIVSRCPVPQNKVSSQEFKKADFADLITIVIKEKLVLGKVLEIARESYITARETNHEVIYAAGNRINEVTGLFSRFTRDNVLPVLDFLNEQKRDKNPRWREVCSSLQMELIDYLSAIGIRTMAVSIGQLLDLERHEPVAASGIEQQTVMEVIAAGYELEIKCAGFGKKVVRRALVRTGPHRGVSSFEG